MSIVSNNCKSKITKLLRNKTMLGIIAGLISGIVKDIIDLITYSLKITDNLFGYLASGIFSEPQSARSTIGLIIGYLADLVMGGFLGFIFVYFIKRTEPE
jgi:ABC-type xylose transport system permease subunit